MLKHALKVITNLVGAQYVPLLNRLHAEHSAYHNFDYTICLLSIALMTERDHLAALQAENILLTTLLDEHRIEWCLLTEPIFSEFAPPATAP